MKRILLLGSLLGLLHGFNVTAQTVSCSESMNRVFRGIPSSKPKLLNQLGTSPQFGEIPNHTAYSAYTHLRKVHQANIRNSREELDTFLQGLGFTGFLDPAFGISSLIPETLPRGTTGWMGAYSQGHQYVWSSLGNPFEGFKIQAKDGSCYAYIMKKCGNAFFVPGEGTMLSAMKDPCAEGKITPDCPGCQDVKFQVKGEGEIHSGQFYQETQTLQVVGDYNGKALDLGQAKVPVKLAYEYSVSAKTLIDQVLPVCDFTGNLPKSSALTIPVALQMQVTSQAVQAGQQGILPVSLTKKQYKRLKKEHSAYTLPTPTVSEPFISVKKATDNPTSTMLTSTDKCTTQTLQYAGKATAEDGSAKNEQATVMVIGVHRKEGKLSKGETADKYLCLGNYSCATSSQLQFQVAGSSSVEKAWEICPDKSVPSMTTLPIDLRYAITKQSVQVGDFGRVYIPLTAKQYKQMSKLYNRCCSDGSTSCF